MIKNNLIKVFFCIFMQAIPFNILADENYENFKRETGISYRLTEDYKNSKVIITINGIDCDEIIAKFDKKINKLFINTGLERFFLSFVSWHKSLTNFVLELNVERQTERVIPGVNHYICVDASIDEPALYKNINSTIMYKKEEKKIIIFIPVKFNTLNKDKNTDVEKLKVNYI